MKCIVPDCQEPAFSKCTICDRLVFCLPHNSSDLTCQHLSVLQMGDTTGLDEYDPTSLQRYHAYDFRQFLIGTVIATIASTHYAHSSPAKRPPFLLGRPPSKHTEYCQQVDMAIRTLEKSSFLQTDTRQRRILAVLENERDALARSDSRIVTFCIPVVHAGATLDSVLSHAPLPACITIAVNAFVAMHALHAQAIIHGGPYLHALTCDDEDYRVTCTDFSNATFVRPMHSMPEQHEFDASVQATASNAVRDALIATNGRLSFPDLVSGNGAEIVFPMYVNMCDQRFLEMKDRLIACISFLGTIGQLPHMLARMEEILDGPFKLDVLLLEVVYLATTLTAKILRRAFTPTEKIGLEIVLDDMCCEWIRSTEYLIIKRFG